MRLITLTPDYYGLSARDLKLARQISAAARALGAPADPSAVQTVQVTIDALVGPEVLPFWRAVLGYRDRGDSPADLIDPHGRGPLLWFQQLDARRPQRNRIHLDVWVPHDQAEARVAAARPRRASRRRSLPAATSSPTRTRRPGGCWPTPRATRPAWPRRWAATERILPCLQRSVSVRVLERCRWGGHRLPQTRR